ncbi:hypothetical protein OU787_03800 [Kitasatospora sp. YST-16]|uniref:hypothetical protein n=1 Tax=Kitasatospora sp. YST-16 TaxID=2998080 RepID=UPI0022841C51|nr:hypothetical protein [Kitasatospora sp. YST-16]WAL70694.1 hypothetical protein OU787_03800 [Kitasatospora sp. YST-16]
MSRPNGMISWSAPPWPTLMVIEVCWAMYETIRLASTSRLTDGASSARTYTCRSLRPPPTRSACRTAKATTSWEELSRGTSGVT